MRFFRLSTKSLTLGSIFRLKTVLDGDATLRAFEGVCAVRVKAVVFTLFLCPAVPSQS